MEVRSRSEHDLARLRFSFMQDGLAIYRGPRNLFLRVTLARERNPDPKRNVAFRRRR